MCQFVLILNVRVTVARGSASVKRAAPGQYRGFLSSLQMDGSRRAGWEKESVFSAPLQLKVDSNIDRTNRFKIPSCA